MVFIGGIECIKFFLEVLLYGFEDFESEEGGDGGYGGGEVEEGVVVVGGGDDDGVEGDEEVGGVFGGVENVGIGGGVVVVEVVGVGGWEDCIDFVLE